MTDEKFSFVETSWMKSADILTRIRTKVFVDEQNVPPELEIDGLDDTCVHYLAASPSGEIIGTARLLLTGQIGRMAVLPQWRKRGIGANLLAACVDGARKRDFSRIFLHAQTHAIDFYSRYGFVAIGDEFDDAGIPHREMVYTDSQPE